MILLNASCEVNVFKNISWVLAKEKKRKRRKQCLFKKKKKVYMSSLSQRVVGPQLHK